MPIRPSAPGSANCVTLTARALQTSWDTFSMMRPKDEWEKRMRKRTIWMTVWLTNRIKFESRISVAQRFRVSFVVFFILFLAAYPFPDILWRCNTCTGYPGCHVCCCYPHTSTDTGLWVVHWICLLPFSVYYFFLTTLLFYIHPHPKDTVNPTKCGCPFALKMAACQLLLEITTFLRETFPCLPRPRMEPLVVSSRIVHNCWLYIKMGTITVKPKQLDYTLLVGCSIVISRCSIVISRSSSISSGWIVARLSYLMS